MFNRLTSDAIFLVFDILPLSTLATLRCTCRDADVHFAQYIGNRLRISLRRFVINVDHLLQEMATTSSVIGGSTALAVVGRCSWTPTNLDIFTPHAYFSHVIAYLINVEHCTVTFDHLRGVLDDRMEDVNCSIIRLQSPSGSNIDVVRSPGQCPLQAMSEFWTTALMCFVSATSICVAYPFLADLNRALLRPTRLLDHVHPHGRTLTLIRKYELRGLTFRVCPLSWEREAEVDTDCHGPGSAYCSLTTRYFGDKHTLTTPHLSLVDGRPIQPPLSYLKTLTLAWWEGGQQCGQRCIGHAATTQPQEHVVSTSVLPNRTRRR